MEPTNAVLLERLNNLKEQMAHDRTEEVGFHARLEGRLDQLAQSFQVIAQQQAVNRAQSDAMFKADKERMDTHESFHRQQEKERKDDEKKDRHTSTLVIGILAVAATLIGTIVGWLSHIP